MFKNDNRFSKGTSFTALGLAVGLVFGGLVGWLIGNPIIFSGGGLVLGLAIGSSLDNRHKKNLL